MRAAREQPRIVIAKALACLCLLAAGVALGAANDRGDRDDVRAMHVRATAAEQTARDRHAELEETRTQLRDATAARARAKHALDRLRSINRRLRRDLDLSQHLLRQARRSQ